MDMAISTFSHGEFSDSELRALRDWLRDEESRPARVELVAGPAESGTMGPLTDTLQVALGAGGALTVLAGSIGTWLKTRKQDVSLKVTRSDGQQLELTAQVVKPGELIEAFLRDAS